MSWFNYWFSTSKSHPADESTPTIKEKISTLKEKVEDQTQEYGSLASFTQPTTLISTAILTTTILTVVALQRRFARRFPNASSVPQTYILPLQRRFTHSLFGRVTSVGDADNFRLFHTPLGLFGLWHTVRQVPNEVKQLRNNTVHIRLAGVDAPELSHFGRPAQPYSTEALDWLTAYVKGRRVRCYLHKSDQYGRIVATAYVRKGLLRRDVGFQMLKAGLATVYEAKSGAEFSGRGVEERYRQAEELAKRKKKGMWQDTNLESPREYKNKYREGTPGG